HGPGQGSAGEFFLPDPRPSHYPGSCSGPVLTETMGWVPSLSVEWPATAVEWPLHNIFPRGIASPAEIILGHYLAEDRQPLSGFRWLGDSFSDCLSPLPRGNGPQRNWGVAVRTAQNALLPVDLFPAPDRCNPG